jgi:hypothetical protein
MIDAPNHLENQMFRRKVSEDGKYEIGIYPVMFGFRVRAGKVGDGYCHIDYCCQTDLSLIGLVYSCVAAIMQEHIEAGKPVFANFPVPENKLYNDGVAIAELVKLATESIYLKRIVITKEELKSYREELFQNLGKSE